MKDNNEGDIRVQNSIAERFENGEWVRIPLENVIFDSGRYREVVRVKSDNPSHVAGFFTNYRDAMLPGQEIYTGPLPKPTVMEPEKQPEKQPEKEPLPPGEGFQTRPVDEIPMTINEIRAELKKKNISVPSGITKKADLWALLNANK